MRLSLWWAMLPGKAMHPAVCSSHADPCVLRCTRSQIARAEHTQAQRLGISGGGADVGSSADLGLLPLPTAFRFNLQDRVQCGESGAVSYKRQPHSLLMLQVGAGWGGVGVGWEGAVAAGKLARRSVVRAVRCSLRGRQRLTLFAPHASCPAPPPASPVLSARLPRLPPVPMCLATTSLLLASSRK